MTSKKNDTRKNNDKPKGSVNDPFKPDMSNDPDGRESWNSDETDDDVKGVDNATTNNTDDNEVPPREPLKPGELKQLFDKYETASSMADRLEGELETARSAKYAAVAAIMERSGKTKFTWKGQKIIGVKKGKTCYFKGESNDDSFVVD